MKLLRYTVLFLIGFCAYITIEVCYRGYSYALMGVCGGLLLIILDLINKNSYETDLIFQGIIGAVIVTFMELIIGSIWLIFNLTPMWSYHNVPFNYYGIISLPYSIIWIFISIAAIMVKDAVNHYVFDISSVPYYKIFGKTVIKFKERPRNALS